MPYYDQLGLSPARQSWNVRAGLGGSRGDYRGNYAEHWTDNPMDKGAGRAEGPVYDVGAELERQKQASDLAQAKAYRDSQNAPRPLTPEQQANLSRQQIQKFIDEMNSPLDYNDPHVMAIMQGTQNRVLDAARSRGIGGPMSMANSQLAMSSAGAGLDLERRKMALAAMQGLSGNDIERQRMATQLQMQDLESKNAFALNDYQNQMRTGGGWGSLIGGLAGGAASFIPGMQAFAPQLIAGGAGIGSAIGGGLASGWGPPPRPYLSGGSQWAGGY